MGYSRLFYPFSPEITAVNRSYRPLETHVQLHCNCMATAGQLHSKYIATAFQLISNCIATAFKLHFNCIATVSQLTCNCVQTAFQLIATVLELDSNCTASSLQLHSTWFATTSEPRRFLRHTPTVRMRDFFVSPIITGPSGHLAISVAWREIGPDLGYLVRSLDLPKKRAFVNVSPELI